MVPRHHEAGLMSRRPRSKRAPVSERHEPRAVRDPASITHHNPHEHDRKRAPTVRGIKAALTDQTAATIDQAGMLRQVVRLRRLAVRPRGQC